MNEEQTEDNAENTARVLRESQLRIATDTLRILMHQQGEEWTLHLVKLYARDALALIEQMDAYR